MNQDNINQPTPSNNPPKTPVTPPPVPPPQAPPPASPPPLPATPPPSTPEPPQDSGFGNQPTDMGVGSPKIGVELEEKETLPPKPSEPPKPPIPPTPSPKPEVPQEEAKIEVSATDIPIKSYDQNRTNEPLASPPVPVSPALGSQPPAGTSTGPTTPAPVKMSSGSPGAVITVLAIMALLVGSLGGFFGFRYWDNLKTSAATESSPSPSAMGSEKTPSLDVSTWSTYSSTLYNFTLKYPNGWSASTTDPSADSIVFASDEGSLSGDLTGFRIEIGFQDAKGKTLKSWVDANSVTTNNQNQVKEISVDGQTAYQQNTTKPQAAVTTYIARGEKIMTVTYTAPVELMSEGGDWYNNLINSITLA